MQRAAPGTQRYRTLAYSMGHQQNPGFSRPALQADQVAVKPGLLMWPFRAGGCPVPGTEGGQRTTQSGAWYISPVDEHRFQALPEALILGRLASTKKENQWQGRAKQDRQPPRPSLTAAATAGPGPRVQPGRQRLQCGPRCPQAGSACTVPPAPSHMQACGKSRKLAWC